MSTKRVRSLLTILLLVGGSGAFMVQGQQGLTPSLSLEEAISAAMEHNAHVKMSRIDAEIAHENYRQTDAMFLPRLDVHYTALLTDNPLNAFGFKLQQRSVTMADFDPAQLNDPSSTRDFTAQVELQQPLVNPDMYFQRLGARAQSDMYRFQEERTRQMITFEVTRAYLQVQLAQKNAAILSESVNRARRMLRFAQNYLEQGLIQKSDELNVRVHLATLETHQTKAESAVENATGGLSLLMGGTSAPFRVDSLIWQLESPGISPGELPEDRADFLALDKAVEASGFMVKASKMKQLPKINAFGSYQWNDDKAWGFDADSYLVGVQMSWNLFSGTQNRHATSARRLEQDRLREQQNQQVDQSRQELNKTWRDLMDARFEVVQQETSVEQAAEALRIVENRHREGLENTNDVLMAQTQWSQQKLMLAQAVFQHHVTVAYLQFLTSSSN